MTLFTFWGDLRENTTPAELYELILHTIGVLFDLNTASLMLFNEKEEVYTTVSAFGQKRSLIENYRPKSDEGIIGRVTTQKSPHSCHITFEILKAGLPKEIQAAELLPILKADTLKGMLIIFDTPLSVDDREILSAFCHQLGFVLDSYLTKNEAQKTEKILTRIRGFIEATAEAHTFEEIFEIILKKITDLLEAEQGSLMILDEHTGELHVKAVKGLHKKVGELIRIKPGEGISGKVFLTGRPYIIEDVEKDTRMAAKRRPRYKTGSFISMPMKINNRVIGVVNCADKMTGGPFAEEDIKFLEFIISYASVAIERAAYIKREEELKKISITDPLTGLLTRKYFLERCLEEIERSKRHSLPLSLVIIDVDDFSIINDICGRSIGDEVLKTIAGHVRKTIRAADVAARYGGEEFAVLLPMTSKQGALVQAERIRTEIERSNILQSIQTSTGQILSEEERRDLLTAIPEGDIPHTPPKGERVTVSIGIATLMEEAKGLEELVRNADYALFNAKKGGKNRVVSSPPSPPA